MITLKFNEEIRKIIDGFAKSIDTDHSNISICYNDPNLILFSRSSKATISAKICFGNVKMDPKVDPKPDIDTKCSDFLKTIEFYGNKPSISFDKNNLIISEGKKKAKLGASPGTYAKSKLTAVQLIKYDITTLDTIHRSISMLNSMDCIVTMKEDYLMVVNSSSRDAIYLVKLNQKLPPKAVGSKDKQFNVVFSTPGKKFAALIKAAIAHCAILKASQVAFWVTITDTNEINSLNFTVSSVTDEISSSCNVLDNAKVYEDVLTKSSEFKPKLAIEVNLLSLGEACALASVTSINHNEDPKITLNNKADAKTLQVKDESGSFFDELEIKTDCKFNITIRNRTLSNILHYMHFGGSIYLEKGVNILTIRNSSGSCFLPCISTTGSTIDIEEIKNESGKVVSAGLGTREESGTTNRPIQKPAGSAAKN